MGQWPCGTVDLSGCIQRSNVQLTLLFSALVEAIVAIKLEYGVKKNRMGDPCFPIKYAWDGVKCSNTNGNTMRITSL